VFPLAVFSVPGVAVYDGERLFLIVFPLWSVLIGRGAENARLWLTARWSPRAVFLGLAAFFALQAYGALALAPCWLSYYNLAVGGLRGAAAMGLEVSYWGDGVTRGLLREVADRVPAGETIAVLPELYDGQWKEVRLQSPPLKNRGLKLVPLNAAGAEREKYVLLFVRPEYLPQEFRQPPNERQVLAVTRREGVLLAVLIRRP